MEAGIRDYVGEVSMREGREEMKIYNERK